MILFYASQTGLPSIILLFMKTDVLKSRSASLYVQVVLVCLYSSMISFAFLFFSLCFNFWYSIYLFLFVLKEFVLFFGSGFDYLGDLSNLLTGVNLSLFIYYVCTLASILSCMFLNLSSSWYPGLGTGPLAQAQLLPLSKACQLYTLEYYWSFEGKSGTC